ncbi:hypothetical protein [Aeromonas veronii]|uniref:hypothetical protein n=1 Tax=Aeromonas veronii TaxID=654 RepID=UPI003003F885
MKNSHGAEFALLLLGAALLLVQALPAQWWPGNGRWLAAFSYPVKAEVAAERLAWREWQDHGAATRVAARVPRPVPDAARP